MKCQTCGRGAYFYSLYLKQGLCKKHLEKMLVRRIKSTVLVKSYKQRRFRMLADGSLGYKMINFVFRKDQKSTLLLKNITLEAFAIDVLKYFLMGKKPIHKIGSSEFFNPLYSTSEEEIMAFLDSKGLKYQKKKRAGLDAQILDIIKEIEKRRPGGMISLVKIGERMDII